ncbi:MAG: Sb-PDE family phosphodiesterase [Gammaproteobacteria bacterium]|nr:Sb-PDE family phosphodiesterase [Gammaproteobacteria bacterium]
MLKSTRRFLKATVGVVAIATTGAVHAHGTVGADDDEARKIDFPDAGEYVTLVTDLHTHSVFSDGHVWPNVRVAEGLRDGLDVLAITEHLEYQPHRLFIPNRDRNDAVGEAVQAAAGTGLLVVSGSEITRDAPHGHMNAVFITDANALWPVGDRDGRELAAFRSEWTPEKAVAEANAQGAFVFWNHPWAFTATPGLRTELADVHRALIDQGQLHGIEIVNGWTYNEEAHRIAVEHDLTFIGTSDVHNLVDWDYDIAGGGHRPVTLVLATERSADAIKEALFAQRTVVWFDDLLIGRDAPLDALLEAGLTMDRAVREGVGVVDVTLRNNMDAPLRLRHLSTDAQSLHRRADLVDVPPQGVAELRVKPATASDEVALTFEVLNALTAPNTRPEVTLRRAVEGMSLPKSYTYDGDPSFTIEFPPGTNIDAPAELGEVFAAQTPDGVTFGVFVDEVVALDAVVALFMETVAHLGSDFDVTENRPITLADGTAAYRSEVAWFYTPSSVELKTQIVSAVKDGKVVWVAAHPQRQMAHITQLVESLRFD